MLRLNFYFFILLFFSSYSYSQNEVVIQKVQHKYECRSCPGKLIIKNGIKTDTLYGGQWGNPPNYEIKKIKNKQVLIIDYNYMFGGGYGYTFKAFEILSLDKNNFLDEIFKKEITLYKESHFVENNIPTNYTYNNNPKITLEDSIKIISNITFKRCAEVEDIDCETILEVKETEYFILEM